MIVASNATMVTVVATPASAEISSRLLGDDCVSEEDAALVTTRVLVRRTGQLKQF